MANVNTASDSCFPLLNIGKSRKNVGYKSYSVECFTELQLRASLMISILPANTMYICLQGEQV